MTDKMVKVGVDTHSRLKHKLEHGNSFDKTIVQMLGIMDELEKVGKKNETFGDILRRLIDTEPTKKGDTESMYTHDQNLHDKVMNIPPKDKRTFDQRVVDLIFSPIHSKSTHDKIMGMAKNRTFDETVQALVDMIASRE